MAHTVPGSGLTRVTARTGHEAQSIVRERGLLPISEKSLRLSSACNGVHAVQSGDSDDGTTLHEQLGSILERAESGESG